MLYVAIVFDNVFLYNIIDVHGELVKRKIKQVSMYRTSSAPSYCSMFFDIFWSASGKTFSLDCVISSIEILFKKDTEIKNWKY